ncbi:hypothetical protein ISF_00393 [Cordyceps fumosorosea ARSEF 2679]|uniref:Wax synthase domain-containing protein n=1 Tax=Cordyceps fumosorosea (strain ARSEF 2679) TaxID=1081104 RepID=A0A162JTD2_CORFA|nr:hypothetical protein ISF_00393 [Cordyceps fumosorosea ARSEF 2679]OAA73492.1 hypothetical protein ISF_00393 [Cordyceps fumosorosea ARSEF 2679]
MQSASPNQASLAPLALASYRSTFSHELAAGRRRQIVLPQAFLTTLILPVVWLAIPHHGRSWRHRSRWLLFAVALFANCEQAARASSNNVAWAVISGLVSAYGTMLCLQHMILTNPQRDAARIIKVPRRKAQEVASTGLGEPPQPAAAAATSSGLQLPREAPRSRTTQRFVGSSEIGGDFCYVWQRFPSEAPFLDRLGWAADLVLSFRGAGWSSSISVIPRPSAPSNIRDGQLVEVASIPSVTNYGFEYIQPPADFLWHRLKLLAGSCLMLDFLGTFMIKDPYFVFGRESISVRRAGNILFTLFWLYATAPLFNDDMADMGLWLLEPMPFSIFRALGFGFPGDAVWRWDSTYLFRWHSGRHWWQSGLAI